MTRAVAWALQFAENLISCPASPQRLPMIRGTSRECLDAASAWRADAGSFALLRMTRAVAWALQFAEKLISCPASPQRLPMIRGTSRECLDAASAWRADAGSFALLRMTRAVAWALQFAEKLISCPASPQRLPMIREHQENALTLHRNSKQVRGPSLRSG